MAVEAVCLHASGGSCRSFNLVILGHTDAKRNSEQDILLFRAGVTVGNSVQLQTASCDEGSQLPVTRGRI